MKQKFNSFLEGIQSVHLSNTGVGYGSSEILNFDRNPNIKLLSGENAPAEAVINNGVIESVIVLNSGSNYNSPPDIDISGDGFGAVVTPILSNGSLSSINVVKSGVGYTKDNTEISITFPGNRVEFSANIQNWRVNNFFFFFEKNFESFTNDDGFISLEQTMIMDCNTLHFMLQEV